MLSKLFIERCLFVVGDPNAGKSVQLRSMFLDRRFGTEGKIPKKNNVGETIDLSNERRLYLRLTSPHEMGETLQEFLKKIKRKTRAGRWNVAGAFQPEPAKKMPELHKIISKLHSQLKPERVRLCFLSPDQNGQRLPCDYVNRVIPAIQEIKTPRNETFFTEIIFMDAREREINGLLLADFFDFT